MFLGGRVSICRERRNWQPSRARPCGRGVALESHHGRKRPRTASGLRRTSEVAGSTYAWLPRAPVFARVPAPPPGVVVCPRAAPSHFPPRARPPRV
jgi:hypothetical protein